MRSKSVLAVVMVAVLVLIMITTHAQNRSPKSQAWEYKSVYSRTTGFDWEKTFNELGAQGWE